MKTVRTLKHPQESQSIHIDDASAPNSVRENLPDTKELNYRRSSNNLNVASNFASNDPLKSTDPI